MPQINTVKVLVTQLCPTLCNPMDCSLLGSPVHGILQARILEWFDISFSRGNFPTQGSNPGLPHSGHILYHLSHQGNPRILEWVAYLFSSVQKAQGPGVCKLPTPPASRALCQAKRAPRAAFPSVSGKASGSSDEQCESESVSRLVVSNSLQPHGL